MSRKILTSVSVVLFIALVALGNAIAQETSPSTSQGLLSSLTGLWSSVVEHKGDIITLLWWELIPLVLLNLVFLFFLEVIGTHPSKAIRFAYVFFVGCSYTIYHVLFKPPVQSYQMWIVWGVLGILIIALLAKSVRSSWQKSWIEKGA